MECPTQLVDCLGNLPLQGQDSPLPESLVVYGYTFYHSKNSVPIYRDVF